MIDIEHILKDIGAVATSGYGTVDGSAQVINLGDGLVRGNIVFDVFKIAIGNNDQLYRLHLMGGSDSEFTNEVSLCCLELGAQEVTEGNQDHNVARYVLPFQNEQAGTIYPYIRIRHEIVGTSPSINYDCRAEKDLCYRGTTNITAITTTSTTTTTTSTT